MDLAKLRASLKAALEGIDSILNKASGEGRALSAEEQKEHDDLVKKSEELEVTLKNALDQEDRRKKLNSPRSESLSVSVVREENHNEDGEYRGYPEYNKGGYGQFLKDVIRAEKKGDETPRLVGLQKSIKKSLAASGYNTTVGSEGGYLTQSDHATIIQDNAYSESEIASECMIVDSDNAELVINLVDESSRATGSRYGGVRAYRRAEAAEMTASKAKFRRETIRAGAMDVLAYITEEQMEDAASLQTLVAPWMVKELAWKLADEIVSGTGTSEQCLGILNGPGTLTIAKEGGQAADTVVYLNVKKMNDRLLVGSEGKAKWYCHPDVIAQLEAMYFTPGSNTDFLLYMPAGGISGKSYDTLKGKPVKRIEQCRALGDLGDILLADFSHYLLLRRKGVTASESSHIKFLTAEKAIRLTQRVGGQPLARTPLTDSYGSTTRSAFVALAERA